MGKPILILDFDGVIHSYVSGWKGADVIPDEPVPGAFKAIEDYAQEFYVCVLSSRSHQEGGIQAMRDWMEKHHPGSSLLVSFPLSKPPALVTIDDRAITFSGYWPEAKELLAFKTWNAKEV